MQNYSILNVAFIFRLSWIKCLGWKFNDVRTLTSNFFKWSSFYASIAEVINSLLLLSHIHYERMFIGLTPGYSSALFAELKTLSNTSRTPRCSSTRRRASPRSWWLLSTTRRSDPTPRSRSSSSSTPPATRTGPTSSRGRTRETATSGGSTYTQLCILSALYSIRTEKWLIGRQYFKNSMNLSIQDYSSNRFWGWVLNRQRWWTKCRWALNRFCRWAIPFLH